MHVVIATDGDLEPDSAAHYAARLAGEAGKVTVLTVVEVPRSVLAGMRSVYGERTGSVTTADAEYIGTAPSPPGVAQDWPGDAAIIDRYMADQRDERCGPVMQALAARDVPAAVVAVESESAASAIMEQLRDLKADVVCIGTLGRGRFEGLLGSVGTKIARLAPCDVVLIRSRS